MSGGSFNYLCYVSDIGELIDKESDLDAMATALAHRGDAADAARETTELLMLIRAARVRADVIAKRLNGVWQAVEWHASCDWGPESVAEALVRYREK